MGNSCTLKIENVAKGREITKAFEDANTCTTHTTVSEKKAKKEPEFEHKLMTNQDFTALLLMQIHCNGWNQQAAKAMWFAARQQEVIQDTLSGQTAASLPKGNDYCFLNALCKKNKPRTQHSLYNENRKLVRQMK